MQGPARVALGLLTDSQKPVSFRFDGRLMRGLAGDTLASALLANGQLIVGRSLKYHRPRGVVSCGPEEPCALVSVVHKHGREPNRLATTLELREGLDARSQGGWPSLHFDALALTGVLSRFMPAGFYYKTFMAPGRAWEKIYEPLLRRAAGLGRLSMRGGAPHVPAETVHDHVDVLVVGAGAAGLAAAQQLERTGLAVMLAEEDSFLGGGSLLDPRWATWRESTCQELATSRTVRCLTRTAVIGAYGHGVYAALETLGSAESTRLENLRERLRIVHTRATILATGAIERLIAFSG